jgi:O-antigen/teichoic acid export membrane protein
MVLRVCENVTSYLVVRKKYPYLNDKTRHELSTEKRTEIGKNIKALITHKLGGTFVLKSDSFIVSRLLDLAITGFLGSYSRIVSGVHEMVIQIFDGIRASFGDFTVQREKAEIKQMFLILQLLSFIIYTWCCVFLLNLSQPFISLWVGKDKQIAFIALAILVFNFYLRGLRSAVDLLKDVKGLYFQDRYKSIVEGIVKVAFSILFGCYFGLTGVILGTTISFVTVLLTVEPYIVYKHVFKEKVWPYYFAYAKYLLIALFICIASLLLNNFLFHTESLVQLIACRALICLIFPPICFTIFFYKTSEFKYLWSLGRSFISHCARRSA